MGKDLIIFDVDGTLFKTEKSSMISIKMAMAELGYEIPKDDFIMKLYGEPMDVFCKSLLKSNNNEENINLARQIDFYEFKMIPKYGELYLGTRQLLTELKANNYELAICTNGGKEYASTVINEMGIRKYFNEIRYKEEGKTKKDIIAELIQGYESAIMVGDRYHDLIAARDNDIQSIWCKYGYGGLREKHYANYVANNPLDILRNIKAIKNLICNK